MKNTDPLDGFPVLIHHRDRSCIGTINAILAGTWKLARDGRRADAWCSWLVSYNVISPQVARDILDCGAVGWWDR